MEPFKNRPLAVGERVQVYYNLTKGGYSIRSKYSGLVLAHTDTTLLSSCRFIVQKGGRLRVHESCQKNVHAYVEGTFVEAGFIEDVSDRELVYYDPYTTPLFTMVSKNRPVKTAESVYFSDKVCFVKGAEFHE